MEETAKNILLWHMALQLPYVPVFTKIGTVAHDGQLWLPKTQRGLCRESERKRGEKSFIASDKCTNVLLQLPQHNQEWVTDARFGQEEKRVLGTILSFHQHFLYCAYSTLRPFSLWVHSTSLWSGGEINAFSGGETLLWHSELGINLIIVCSNVNEMANLYNKVWLLWGFFGFGHFTTPYMCIFTFQCHRLLQLKLLLYMN